MLNKSVDLCHRYIKNKCFPDKALDVVDAAGARVKLRGEENVTLKDVIHVISKISNVGTDVIDIESVDTYKNLDTRMSEYMERHSVSKLIGAPPGYVGHAEGKLGQGLMLAEVEENPNCVLLLDEVEKAAPEVLQVLLQVMDDGRLTGSTGKEVDFSNVILLMTSNLGATDAEGLKIGFGDQTKLKAVDKAVEKFFSPEFRNRLDSTITFNKLAIELMHKIVDRLVKETNELLVENESTVTISITDACRLRLAEDGYEPSMGARPLKRVFEDNVKKPLSKKILFEDLSNINISVDIQNDEYVFVL